MGTFVMRIAAPTLSMRYSTQVILIIATCFILTIQLAHSSETLNASPEGKDAIPLAEKHTLRSEGLRETISAWTPWLLRLGFTALLCAASSPSPIGLPLALVFAFQPEFVHRWWSMALDALGPDMLLTVGLPAV